MVEADKIWVNGEFKDFDEAKIHLLNHSLHYGSGVFEGIRFYETNEGPAIFRLEDHTERFLHSAETMGYDLDYSEEELNQTIIELIEKNDFKSGYIRPIAFYGQKMGLLPGDAEENVSIAAWEWGQYLDEEAVKVKISSYIRVHPESSVMTAKISGNYANSILASQEVKEEGYDEALLLDSEGRIAEGPGENIFFVKDQTLHTPRRGTILPGITRDTIIQIAEDKGYDVKERIISSEELISFDEAFFVGTAAEVNAIGSIDEIEFSNGEEGEITEELRKEYKNTVKGKKEEYKNWLTHI